MDTPAFVDTDSCHCRLRSFPREATINAEKPARAWHCVRQDEATGPVQARAEKWFLQISGEGRRESIGDDEDEGYRLPDTRTWYHTVREEGQSLRLLRASDATELHLRKGRCTGEVRGEGSSSQNVKPLLSQRHVRRQRPSGDGRVEDTDAGNTETGEGTADDFFTSSDEETPSNKNSVSNEQTSVDKPLPTDGATSNKEEVASTTGPSAAEISPGPNVDSPEYKYLHSCRRGDQAVAVQIQDNSSWNDVGCLAGFLCK